jgi:hypothetical protein
LIQIFALTKNGKPKEPEMIRLLSSLRYECYKVSSDELLPANAFHVPNIFASNLCAIFKTVVSVRSSNRSPKALDAGRIFCHANFSCQLETQIVKPISTKLALQDFQQSQNENLLRGKLQGLVVGHSVKLSRKISSAAIAHSRRFASRLS